MHKVYNKGNRSPKEDRHKNKDSFKYKKNKQKWNLDPKHKRIPFDTID